MSVESVFSSDEMQMVTFNLADESFGIDIMHVQEIIRKPGITFVPQAPEYVDGVTNLRGQILPVIDTRTKFGMPKRSIDNLTRVIVVDARGKTVGLNVDAVSEVLRIGRQSIEEAPSTLSQEVDKSYLTGVVKLNEGKKLVMVLDVASLCSIEQRSINEAAAQPASGNTSQIREVNAIEEMQIVSFMVGQEEYALDINRVKEIIRFPEIIKVPNVPEHLKGIISLRETLMPIIDLRTRLQTGSDEITDSTRVVVADGDGTIIGLTVDKVYEVTRVPKNAIFTPPQLIAGDSGEKITGIIRLEEGKRIIMLLDLLDMISEDVIDEIKKHENISEELSTTREAQSASEEQMVVFRLAGEQYGVRINQVQEINRLSKITRVPRAPGYLEGVVNLRGDVIPVIDLRKRFDLESKEYNQFTRIIVSDVNKKKVGIIVDEVLEVLRISERHIEDAPDVVQDQKIRKYLEGIANLSDRMVMMLNLENLLKADEWQKLASIGDAEVNHKQTAGRQKNKAGVN